MRACIYVNVQIYIHVCMCTIPVCVYVCAYLCVDVCVYVYVYEYMTQEVTGFKVSAAKMYSWLQQAAWKAGLCVRLLVPDPTLVPIPAA